MRAALIGNRDDIDPGFVGQALRRRGYSFIEYVREDFESWSSLEGIDLVVSMGSGWSTYWDHVAGPVQAEQSLLRKAMDSHIPVLGICFGAQQLAVTLGGEVTKAQSPEIGWFSVETIPETTGFAPSVLTEGPWMQWHYDTFTPPAGAEVLGLSDAGPQALRIGRSFATQFHPEKSGSAGLKLISNWVDSL